MAEVIPIQYGDHLHYISVATYEMWKTAKVSITTEQDQKLCNICVKQDGQFANMRNSYGDELLWERLQRNEKVKAYYRKYPYDGWQRRADMEDIDVAVEDDTLEQLIADESREEILASLTPKELETVLYAEQGYKPRDIAAKTNKPNSGSIRWHKHMVKRKLEERLDVQKGL